MEISHLYNKHCSNANNGHQSCRPKSLITFKGSVKLLCSVSKISALILYSGNILIEKKLVVKVFLEIAYCHSVLLLWPIPLDDLSRGSSGHLVETTLEG